jgi:hypothetical protein
MTRRRVALASGSNAFIQEVFAMIVRSEDRTGRPPIAERPGTVFRHERVD